MASSRKPKRKKSESNTALVECQECHKSLPASRLNTHRKIHTDEFKCHVCGKGHEGRSKLEAHQRTHRATPPPTTTTMIDQPPAITYQH